MDFLSSESSFALKVIGAVASATGLSWFLYNNSRSKRHPWPVVPGAFPILGHFPYIGGLPFLIQRLEQWADDYAQETGIYDVTLGPGLNVIVCCRADTALAVLEQRPFHMHRLPMVADAMSSTGAEGLFSAEEDNFRRETRLVRPTFNRSQVEGYLALFQQNTEALIQKWRHDSQDRGVVTVDMDLRKALADTISTATLDTKLDFLHQPQSVISRDIDLAFSIAVKRCLSPVAYWHIPFIGQHLDGAASAMYRLRKLWNDRLNEIEEERRLDTGKRNISFIHKLYDMMQSEKVHLPRPRVLGNILTLFLAGADTTSAALSCALFHLASTPALFQTLQAEAMKFDGKAEGIQLQDIFDGLPKLKSFLHEIHRFHTNPHLILRSQKEMSFQGTPLPAGTNFVCLMHYVTNQDVTPSEHVPLGPNGERPSRFCASRWLQRKDDGTLHTPAPHHMAILGFGYGPRACPGRMYSEALSLLILAHLLSQVDSMELTRPADNYKVIYDSMMKYDHPVDIQFQFKQQEMTG